MAVKKDKKSVLAFLKNLSLVVLGTIILSFGVSVFMIPFDLVAGGVAGIAIALGQIVPEEIMSVELMVTIFTWVIFVIGFIALGKNFAMKTLVSSIVYPASLALFQKLVSPDALGGYFYLEGGEHAEFSILIAAICGGALVGVGCALTFLGGGSTGGTDIIAFTICKIFPKLKTSVVIFFVDCSVITLGVFAIGDLIVSLLGIVAATVGALLIDKVFLGGSKSFIAQIISERYEEIRDKILVDLDRGATVIDVVGAYSGEPKKMIMVSFTMSQYNQIISIINKSDKNAFVTVHRAHEVNGIGFTTQHPTEK